MRKIRNYLLRYTTSIACSNAIASALKSPSVVIPNPYAAECFRVIPGVRREKELIFVGRLVSDKGIDGLIDAMHQLAKNRLNPNLTIVGTGEDQNALLQQAKDLGIDKQVNFVGRKSRDEIAALLNQHRILVVPSIWAEPFGIVALEGIACGCVVVGSSGGGLQETIGPCGFTFRNGDTRALANCLQTLLLDLNTWEEYRNHAPSHLQMFTGSGVASAYLKVLCSSNVTA